MTNSLYNFTWNILYFISQDLWRGCKIIINLAWNESLIKYFKFNITKWQLVGVSLLVNSRKLKWGTLYVYVYVCACRQRERKRKRVKCNKVEAKEVFQRMQEQDSKVFWSSSAVHGKLYSSFLSYPCLRCRLVRFGSLHRDFPRTIRHSCSLLPLILPIVFIVLHIYDLDESSCRDIFLLEEYFLSIIRPSQFRVEPFIATGYFQ